MLVSFDKKFIFIANTKAASTSVEHAFKRYSNVIITRQKFGKHFTYKTIVAMFQPVFESSGVPPEAYFRFGVIRDPLSWLVSWYNYRRRDALSSNSPKSTRGIGIEEFIEEATSTAKRRPFAHLGLQANKFLDADGNLGVDFLIPLPHLQEDLEQIRLALGLPQLSAVLKSKNVSPRVASVDDVPESLRRKVEQRYARDRELFENAMRRGFGEIEEVVQSKRAMRA